MVFCHPREIARFLKALLIFLIPAHGRAYESTQSHDNKKRAADSHSENDRPTIGDYSDYNTAAIRRTASRNNSSDFSRLNRT